MQRHGSITTGVTARTGGDVELRNLEVGGGDLTLVQDVAGLNVTLEATGSLVDGGGEINMESPTMGALQLVAGDDIGADANDTGNEIIANDVNDLAAIGDNVFLHASGADVSVTEVEQHRSLIHLSRSRRVER